MASAAAAAFPSVSITAKSALVIDIESGQVLYEKNADAQLPLASLTKVPLALAVSEVLPPDTQLVVPHEIPPTSTLTAIKAGSVWHSQDLLDLTLAASSNDGAELLAALADEPLRVRYPEAPAGGAAVYRMNALAKTLGLSHTYFLNATGLDETSHESGAYGSARDIAKLFAYAATSAHDLFAATTRPEFTATSQSGDHVTARNTDHALDDIPNLIMGKTGYTDLAGGNLAVAYTSGSDTIVAVVLGSTQEGRFDDMRTLVAATQSAFDTVSHK
jgi:D-alanyl-D-alanine carboxypeptidase